MGLGGGGTYIRRDTTRWNGGVLGAQGISRGVKRGVVFDYGHVLGGNPAACFSLVSKPLAHHSKAPIQV